MTASELRPGQRFTRVYEAADGTLYTVGQVDRACGGGIYQSARVPRRYTMSDNPAVTLAGLPLGATIDYTVLDGADGEVTP